MHWSFMGAKRLATGLKLMAVLAGLALVSQEAAAQHAARAGVEAHPAPSVTSTPTVFSRPVAVSLVPIVTMSDGSIFANFGFGFERVVRPCSNTLAVGQPTVVASNGVVLSQPQQPTYTQPVPNQQSQSQLMVNGSQQTSLSIPAQRACFNRDVSGRVFVNRP
jgi:hypothetical protein